MVTLMTETTRNRSSLTRYLADIRAFPRLSREDELLVGERISLGSGEAKHELVVSNLGFVVKIASEYQNMGLPFEDLLSEGNLGLIRAASSFDHRRGIKFITYASWWVRKSIRLALSDKASLIRVPPYQKKKRAAPLRLQSVSIDEVLPGESGARLTDLLVDQTSEDPERKVIQRQDLAGLVRSLSLLSETERTVILHRFGLDGRPTLTLRQIGANLGLTRERIRQIEAAAKLKLRARLHGIPPEAPRRPQGKRTASRRARALVES
jgi:RNA polymerase primary sigma factor